ncbi:DNA translocase FtsK [Wenyingzhuangia sp. 2_MG-2023]|uniref:DNA translocase FtsK n=1 Tax=Wenyingzhuangia sp. 2_MG-2023 TaxID=3062639 RepID=UPI0026E3BA36|nr:DNA translocase FtsK [Wenyingzhuangia sp. 2_MG-2023]MDO6737134.1 DNA translocase FtsK [Wenyingzhuangia sp. 2_MG-2023]
MSRQNQFRNLTPEQSENHFSNFLIDSCSYSKVTAFARNEKAFEMTYIYRMPFKSSASNIAGKAYHEALKFYFDEKKLNIDTDIVDLQTTAYNFIESVPANDWKLQATTPTIDKCIEKATKDVNALLSYFIKEVSIYDFVEILYVETYLKEFLIINGVDIPIPFSGIIDLVLKTSDGKIVIVDHKSKSKYSNEDEIALSVGKQAVTYYNLLFEVFGIKADEVWFVENKASKNRGGGPQLVCFKIPLDKNNIKLFEALLYEPLRRMIQAVQDPDYVYLMNEDDNYVDKAELHAFWAKTMIAEVDDFIEIPDDKKEVIGKRLKKIRDSSITNVSPTVIKKFRDQANNFIRFDLKDKNMTKEAKIEYLLKTFNTLVETAHKIEGYAYDTFLLRTSMGTNIASVKKYKLDIANALDVSNVRIQSDLVVHENESFVSIEVPKKRNADLFWDPKYLSEYKIPIGLDNLGNLIFWDLKNHSTPHVITCGATGSGKSAGIFSQIEYMLLAGIKDIVILDPKNEFSKYKNTPGIEVIEDIEDIEAMMELLVDEMKERTQSGYKKFKVIIFDEFADAVANSKKGNALKVYENQIVGEYKNGKPKYKRVHVDTKKSLEENLQVLLQKGRSLGFRIHAATQRASVKVINGDAKANFPVQICYRVPKEVDSKVVIDEGGAELLQGRGDGLIKSPELLSVTRFQSFFKPE